MCFKSFISAALLCCLFTGCEKNDPLETAGLGVGIVTGYESRDEVGNVVSVIGIPNNRNCIIRDQTGICRQFIHAFPNPASGQASLIVVSDANANLPARVSLIRQQAPTNLSVPGFQAGLLINQELPPLYEPFDVILVPGVNNFGLDLSTYNPGFYRVYLQLPDVVLWDNLVIQNTRF